MVDKKLKTIIIYFNNILYYYLIITKFVSSRIQSSNKKTVASVFRFKSMVMIKYVNPIVKNLILVHGPQILPIITFHFIY